MKDKVFLDSNILIYSYSNSEPQKQEVARSLIAIHQSVISTQVLQEVTNTITRKFNFSYSEAKNVITECCGNNSLHFNTEDTLLKACPIAQKYGYSFYGSLIISAALESGCAILYYEDMQNGQNIEDCLVIVNPFI